MRILFVGNMQPYLVNDARVHGFREMGIPVEVVDQRPHAGSESRVLRALTYRTLLTPAVFSFNRELLRRAREMQPEVIWIEKGVYVFPRTLRALKRCGNPLLVYHNTDDWKAQDRAHAMHWRFLLRCLRDYDVHITSNLHNVREFEEAGLPHVLHMELAANQMLEDPWPFPEEERRELGAQVGFVGHWEPETEALVLHLVRNGIRCKVFGQGWGDAKEKDELENVVQYRWVGGPEYAKAIVSFDINLGVVSKWNRNHTASRTYQIPALGAFLIHERNEVVTEHFVEGQEAEFFSDPDELLRKCRYYLDHPEERERIAAAGRQRCIESGYFEDDRLRAVLPEIERLATKRRAQV